MLKARDLFKLGFEPGPSIGVALKLIPDAQRALGRRVLENDLKALITEPNAYKEHPHLALLAQALLDEVLSSDWTIPPVVQRVAEKARAQLGTSGSGNHFAEFGVLTIPDNSRFTVDESKHHLAGGSGAFGELGPGKYLALLSHSGS